ncbi:MAG: AmmeMemoRadiSam system radical SAM enzyme, partial [Thaumarchaeota archaeon]|nr:AmmeMemoRadiSam system radical SAM enzyme [Nitrososphaerota archaeon]
LICERKCILEEGKRGFCKTKMNIRGKIYTVVYGDISALESRPIEIKPFFHFWPGSTALTFSTWSCNFICPWCQNWNLSKVEPSIYNANYIPPEKVVEMALRNQDEGICVSFNEPLMLFEYSLDVFKVAKNRNLYNTFVSNGYMTLEALKMLKEAGLDGLKIDVKGSREEYKKFNVANVEVVWRNAREAKKLGIHVEIVYLVVTGATDEESTIEDVIKTHVKELGQETPIHFTRYYPAYMYNEPPTPIEKLEWAYKRSKEFGVLFPYVGNVPGHAYENTYCPNCGELLIKRYNTLVLKYRVTEDGRCPRCNMKIPITGRYVNKTSFF